MWRSTPPEMAAVQGLVIVRPNQRMRCEECKVFTLVPLKPALGQMRVSISAGMRLGGTGQDCTA